MVTFTIINRVKEFKEVDKIKDEVMWAINRLPEYGTYVDELKVFIGNKNDLKVLKEANMFTGNKDVKVKIVSNTSLMTNYLLNKKQSIVIFYEDYLCENKYFRKILLHEFGHAICGHVIRKGYDIPFVCKLLIDDGYKIFIDHVRSIHRDYDVDKYLIKKFPELILEWINHSVNHQVKSFNENLETPDWKNNIYNITIFIVLYYQNKFILTHIESEFGTSRLFQNTQNLLRNHLQNIKEVLIIDHGRNNLSEELLIEDDFSTLFDLLIKICLFV